MSCLNTNSTQWTAELSLNRAIIFLYQHTAIAWLPNKSSYTMKMSFHGAIFQPKMHLFCIRNKGILIIFWKMEHFKRWKHLLNSLLCNHPLSVQAFSLSGQSDFSLKQISAWPSPYYTQYIVVSVLLCCQSTTWTAITSLSSLLMPLK